MFKKILISFVLFFCVFGTSFAHTLSTETITYMLSNPDSTWEEFEAFAENSDDSIVKNAILDSKGKIAVALDLPNKKFVVNYVEAHPDFTFTEIDELVGDDPMFRQIGAEAIYSFLVSTFRENDTSFSFDFFVSLVVIGFEHITAGYDHILFLLTLIICFPRLRNILLIITTFTVSHSLTLILGGLKIVSIPSVITESMILISIIIMALYAFKKKVGGKENIYLEMGIIFILGLFHGLGFAGFFGGVLETSNNIIIPILGFNLGVELGQIVIMLIMLGILSLVYKVFDTQKEYIKNTLSGVAIIMAAYWLVLMFV